MVKPLPFRWGETHENQLMLAQTCTWVCSVEHTMKIKIKHMKKLKLNLGKNFPRRNFGGVKKWNLKNPLCCRVEKRIYIKNFQKILA